MKKIFISFFVLLFGASSLAQYPTHWWEAASNPKSWEVSAHTAIKNKQVVLSKRNELGLFSNFAHTPFIFNKKHYKSVEGLWQSMKYPENLDDPKDPRTRHKAWPHTRAEVEQMIGATAKQAGSKASQIMKILNINWVTYNGERLIYRTQKKGAHYRLIKRILKAKIEQNPKVKALLIKTRSLVLLSDHKMPSPTPPAWQYNQIYMDLR